MNGAKRGGKGRQIKRKMKRQRKEWITRREMNGEWTEGEMKERGKGQVKALRRNKRRLRGGCGRRRRWNAR